MTLTFTHENKVYEATLKEIPGAAYVTYYLLIDGYFRGKLWYSDKWHWDSILFPEIKDQLVSVVEGK